VQISFIDSIHSLRTCWKLCVVAFIDHSVFIFHVWTTGHLYFYIKSFLC